MDIKEFIKTFLENNDYTNIILQWEWMDDGIDEEYSFEGCPSDFLNYYTKHYDCIDDMTLFDVAVFKIENVGCRTFIWIEIVRD